MKKVVIDIETNGLFDTVDTIWIVGVKEVGSEEVITFSDFDRDSKPLNELKDYLDTVDVLIGHNIISYDLIILQKLLGYKLKDTVKTIDTMILSMMNNWRRAGKHSLKNFGRILGDDKIEFSEFNKYSDEMKTYLIQDVNLNEKTYKWLSNESKALIDKRPNFKGALQLEHSIAAICAQQMINKWKFDIEKAKKHYIYLTNEMKKIEDEINPQLKEREILIDKEPKTAKFTANGNFSAVTARMLSEYLDEEIKVTDIDKWDRRKTFQRKKLVEADLGNMDQVRLLLLDNGWKPSQFTPGGEPKITEDSLATCDTDIGKKISHYYSMRNRHSVLRGWIELATENDGKVYVEAFNIGTPTFRQRHSKVVNVPSLNSFFGKEMRELFIANEGKVMVGCDSSGNQIRALAHYINSEEVNHHILNGDIHQRNADIIGVSRPMAKGILYATIFGAGMRKLGKMVTGKEDLAVGKDVKGKLYVAFPGLKELIIKLNKFFHVTEYQQNIGWIPGLDGRKIYAEGSFKCLNYLLQCYEAIIVKAAIVNAFEMFKKENLDVKILAMVHDEVQTECNQIDAHRVSEILEYSFGEFVTKKYELNIQMDGEAKIGLNWNDTH